MVAASTRTEGTTHQTQDFTACVRMVAAPDVTDEFLEELTFLVENALGKYAEGITPGASASANFANRQIELDFIVAAASPEDLHQKLGEVIRIALAAVPAREPSQVAFAGSATSSVLALA